MIGAAGARQSVCRCQGGCLVVGMYVHARFDIWGTLLGREKCEWAGAGSWTGLYACALLLSETRDCSGGVLYLLLRLHARSHAAGRVMGGTSLHGSRVSGGRLGYFCAGRLSIVCIREEQRVGACEIWEIVLGCWKLGEFRVLKMYWHLSFCVYYTVIDGCI